jgi:Transposase, Mutator family
VKNPRRVDPGPPHDLCPAPGRRLPSDQRRSVLAKRRDQFSREYVSTPRRDESGEIIGAVMVRCARSSASWKNSTKWKVSSDLISTVTDSVLEDVIEWKNRPLELMYPVVFFDALKVRTRDERTVKNKAVYGCYTNLVGALLRGIQMTYRIVLVVVGGRGDSWMEYTFLSDYRRHDLP